MSDSVRDSSNSAIIRRGLLFLPSFLSRARRSFLTRGRRVRRARGGGRGGMGIKFQAIHLPLPVGLLGGSSFAALRSAELLIGCPICSLLLTSDRFREDLQPCSPSSIMLLRGKSSISLTHPVFHFNCWTTDPRRSFARQP